MNEGRVQNEETSSPCLSICRTLCNIEERKRDFFPIFGLISLEQTDKKEAEIEEKFPFFPFPFSLSLVCVCELVGE